MYSGIVKFLTIFIPLLLTACAPKVWFKPGGSQDAFRRDRYDCIQEAQQRVSGAIVNSYGGAATNTVATNNLLFNSCMNAKGYNLMSRKKAREQQTQQLEQLQERKNSIKETFDELDRERQEVCKKDDFKIFYVKSSCKAEDLTLEQLADKTKINDAEKFILQSILSESKANVKKGVTFLKSIGDAKALELASLAERYEALTEKNALDLYEGKISWGEYNKRRKEISQNSRGDFNQIISKK